MSSAKREKSKVIEIRPFHEFQQVEKETNNNEQLEKTTLDIEVEEAKQQLHSIEEQRKVILQELKEEIEKERTAWEETKKAEMEQIKQEGYKVGYEDGKTSSLNKYSYLIEEANELTESASQQYYEQISQHESTIIHLAIQIAEKILTTTLDEQPDQFIPIVQAAILDLKDNETFNIYLHPANYEDVLKQKDELYESVSKTATISLYIDDKLQKNSCLIKHASGKVDASVNTQLTEVKQVLIGLVEKNI